MEEHNASIEAITLDNQTALHFSAKYGQLSVCQKLLALGANPNARKLEKSMLFELYKIFRR